MISNLLKRLFAANLKKHEYRQSEYHPYLADMGGLFGARSNLHCVECRFPSHELFYGLCKKCAIDHNVPMKTPSPHIFQKTMDVGQQFVIRVDDKETT